MSVISANDSEFDIILNEARKFVQMGKDNDAIALLNKAIAMENSRGEAFDMLGDLYDNLGQKEKAILTYKKGIKAHPNFVDNYFDLAVLYGQQIPIIRENLLDYPIFYLAETIARANEFLLKAAYLGDAESKEILIQQGIKASTKEEFISELTEIANNWLKAENFEEAKSVCSFIVKNDSNNEDAIKVLFMCNFNIGQNDDQQMKYKKAYKSYREAYNLSYQLYKKDAHNEEYIEFLGVILFTIGNLFGSLDKHEKAIEYLEKSKSLIGNKYEIFKSLGQEYYFNEQIEKSNKYLAEYAITNNISLDNLLDETKLLQYYKYLDKVNLLAGNEGHSQKEFDFIRRAINLFPIKQDAYSWLGNCYRDMGDKPNALEAYRKALDVEPDDGFSATIRKAIEEL